MISDLDSRLRDRAPEIPAQPGEPSTLGGRGANGAGGGLAGAPVRTGPAGPAGPAGSPGTPGRRGEPWRESPSCGTAAAAMKDVATRAGVALKTVSRVVNDEPGVTPETASRVRNAINELGFRRNDSARLLRKGQTASIGLIMEDIGDPFYSALSRAVEDVAHWNGSLLFTGSSDEDPQREQELVAGVVRAAGRRADRHPRLGRPPLPAAGNRGRGRVGVRGPAGRDDRGRRGPGGQRRRRPRRRRPTSSSTGTADRVHRRRPAASTRPPTAIGVTGRRWRGQPGHQTIVGVHGQAHVRQESGTRWPRCWPARSR